MHPRLVMEMNALGQIQINIGCFEDCKCFCFSISQHARTFWVILFFFKGACAVNFLNICCVVLSHSAQICDVSLTEMLCIVSECFNLTGEWIII